MSVLDPPNPLDIALTSADGVALVGRSWEPGTAPKAAMILVHGLKDHGRRYDGTARRLAGRGYAVYAFDLRGHGRSGGVRAWVRRFHDYMSDLKLVHAEVHRRHPTIPLFLFGHSMGGTISTLHSAEASPGVSGLVLSAAALRPGASVSRVTIAFTKFLGRIAPRAALFKTLNSDFSRDPRVVEAMNVDPLILQGPAPIRTAAELLRGMGEVSKKMARLDVPLLILHGTADRLTNPEGSRQLLERASSVDKTLKLYPGLYHDLLHEPEHEVVVSEIVQWLDSRVEFMRTSVSVGPAHDP